MEKGQKLEIIAWSVFLGAAFIGGAMELYDTGVIRGRRMQYELDAKLAEKKGIEL